MTDNLPTVRERIAPADYEPPQEALTSEDYNYRLPIEDIIYCIDVLKMTQQQTADRLGCTHSNISQRLKTYGYQKGFLKEYKRNAADMLAIRRMRIAKHLSDEKLENSSAYQLHGMEMYALDAETKLRKEGTNITTFNDDVRVKQVADAKIKAFKDKYGITDEPDTTS